MKIKYDESRNQKEFVVRTILHIKQSAIILVFLCSPLTFCIFVFSSNLIHKQCDKNSSGSRKIAFSCKVIKNSITNSDISSINPLNAALKSLLRADLLDTVSVRTILSDNQSIYHSGFTYFIVLT